MGLKVPGVAWPLIAGGELQMGAQAITFQDTRLRRSGTVEATFDDGAAGGMVFKIPTGISVRETVGGTVRLFRVAATGGSGNLGSFAVWGSQQGTVYFQAGAVLASGGASYDTPDVGFVCEAAGRFLVNNGAPGSATARDLAARQLIAGGDNAGVAGRTSLTNGENLATPRSTGVGTIKFADATARDNVGFIKIYIGATAHYIPVFVAN